MHEWSVVQSLLARVEETARAHGAVAVRRIEVAIGELAGIDPALLDAAYELFRPGTPCAGAPLAIRSVPARWACASCGASVARGAALWCAACAAPARLASGDEITLERVELEVRDV